MLKKLLCIAVVMSVVACSPAKPKDAGGVFDAGQEDLKISRDERDPSFNVLSYTQRDETHAVIEKSFYLRVGERATYSLFDYTFQTSQCLEDKGRADYNLFLVSGAGMQKLENTKPFSLAANDVIKVTIDNKAGCKSVYLRFAAVKE